jgi:hypothetical protein
VLDNAGLEAIQANKAEAAEDLFGRKDRGENFFVCEAVLEGEDCRVRINEWRNEGRELVVGGGFDGDENEIAGTDLVGSFRAFGTDVEVAFGAENFHAVTANVIVIGAEKKMQFVAGMREFRAVIAADCAGTHNCDFHLTSRSRIRRKSRKMKKAP